MRMRVLLFAGIAAVSALAVAQQYTESVQVTVVEIPVTVVDRAGNPINGLTKEDFEVTDDGKKANIVGFEMIDMSKYAVADTATPLPPPAYRNFLLLFDITNSTPATIGRAQAAALEFVESQISRRDIAAVATFSVEQGLQVVTSFTTDQVLLEKAIKTLGDPKWFKVADPLRIAGMGDGGGMNPAGEERVEGDNEALVAEHQKRINEMAQRANDEEMRGRLRRQLGSFGNVARMLDTLRGQKQVILLSEGFDPKLVEGKTDSASQKQQSEALLRGEVYNVNSDEYFGSAASTGEISRMAEIFRRSDVTMHAIDIKGLRSNVDASEGTRKTASNEGLHLISRPTGGSVFKNANDLGQNFAKLLKQQETLYLVAIETKAQKTGKFHTLKVKVAKAKGGKVTHRAGYYESMPRTSPLEQMLSLADIMMTDANIREVPLSVTAMPLPSKTGKGVRLPVVVEIPGTKLLENVTGNSVSANLFVYAFDEQYQIKDFLQQRIALDVAKNGPALREAGLRYVGMLNVPPGKYAVKALVRVEESGRVGFLRSDVDVPATNGPAVLPPVFVDVRPGWINVAQPGTGMSAVAAFTAAGKAFVPARNVALKADGSYRLALFLYDTPSEGLDVTPAVIAADGSTLPASISLVGRAPADAEGASKVLLDFKPDAIAAGNYKLQLTVKPKDGQQSVVDVPFRIE